MEVTGKFKKNIILVCNGMSGKACIHICMYVYMYVCMCIQACVQSCTCMHVPIRYCVISMQLLLLLLLLLLLHSNIINELVKNCYTIGTFIKLIF